MNPRVVSLLIGLLFITVSCASANPVKEKFEEAMNAFGRKDFKKAISLYQETLVLYPSLAAAYNFMALSHKEIGASSQKVESLLKKAIEVDPTFAAPYDNLSKHYYSQGEFELAKEYGLKAVKIAPESITAKLSLAWTYLLGLDQPDEAIVYFKEVAQSVQLPYAYFGLGMAYYMDDQRILVMEMITKLRDINEESFAQQLEAMVRDGNYDRALAQQPLLRPKVKKKAVLVSNDLPSLADVAASQNMPVRVRKERIPSLREEGSAGHSSNRLSGTDRIQAMQGGY